MSNATTDTNHQIRCWHCEEPIQPGEARRPLTHPNGQSSSIHERCHVPESPVPHFCDISAGDQVVVEVNGVDSVIVGNVVGTGQTHDPATGRFIRIEAKMFGSLPSGEMYLIHEYNGRWGEVHCYVDNIQVEDEEIVDNNWQDEGAVTRLSLRKDILHTQPAAQ